MQKLEWLLIVALGALVVLAAAIVVVGPRLGRRSTPSDQGFEPGETETMPARVVEVLEEGTVDLGEGSTQPYQRLLLRVEGGSMAGQEMVVEEGTTNIISQERLFKPGDRVYLERAVGPEEDRFYISDVVRIGPLLGVVTLFVVLVVLVGRGKGLRSLGGSLFGLAVIFAFILPQIMAGRDPVGVSIVGSILLLSVSTYLTYGLNFKAHAAVAGMALSLALTGGLAWLFVGWTRLTGMSVEESSYLVMELGSGINLRGLVLGGIIIGSLGVLDDVCVAQASAVFELINANRESGWMDLFRSSLNIGRDHIAAMVNTLLLAYVGGSMPLMLAFTIYQEPLWRRVNREPIAEEIVRTLVGSTGLVLAVPITGFIASLLARWTGSAREGQGARAAVPKAESRRGLTPQGGPDATRGGGETEEQGGKRQATMLNRLLELLREGGTRRITDLANELDTTPELVEAMLEDLARMGYLKRVSGQCSEKCAACPLAGMCSAGGASCEAGSGQVWAFAEKRE